MLAGPAVRPRHGVRDGLRAMAAVRSRCALARAQALAVALRDYTARADVTTTSTPTEADTMMTPPAEGEAQAPGVGQGAADTARPPAALGGRMATVGGADIGKTSPSQVIGLQHEAADVTKGQGPGSRRGLSSSPVAATPG